MTQPEILRAVPAFQIVQCFGRVLRCSGDYYGLSLGLKYQRFYKRFSDTAVTRRVTLTVTIRVLFLESGPFCWECRAQGLGFGCFVFWVRVRGKASSKLDVQGCLAGSNKTVSSSCKGIW